MAGESELVGSAHVDIGIDASPAEAALARLESKADRTFAELGRKKAEASLDVKTTDFDRKIDKAKGELANLEDKHARVSVSLKGDIEKEIAEVKAEIKQLDREKATIKVDSRQLKAANKEQRLMSEARALDERHALNQAKAERALTTERQRSVTTSIKSRAELAKLSAEYEKLAGRQKSLKKSSAGIFSPHSIGTAEKEARKLERVGAEMDLVAHKIERLGGSVEHLDPELRKNSSTLDRWLSRLGDTSIRIGPLTTSLKGLGVGLGLLGPLVFELAGGVTSLIGFLGSGLAGAAAVGAGALGGLATSALGVGLVIKPMISEFSEVKKASLALNQAQLKYGKGSEQAKTAQERLNNELHGVSPIAREAFESYGQLGSRWRDLTKAAKPAVFNAFGQSLKTAQALLPGFARESTKTTQVAAKAWDGWMKSLRSSEAKGLLNNLMGDFRASIPSLAAGLASLGAMIGRIGAAGAHFLPGLSHGFADWANSLEKSVGGGQKLTGEIGGMVNNMRDFGHLTQDTGSFLVHFFGASAHAGDGLSNSLDHVIQKWDRWSQTAEGKSSLKNFFSESKTATEDFMSSLGHFTELLFQFSRATAPVANGLLKVVTFIGDIVSAADQVVGVKTIFQDLGIVLAGLFVASKVMSYGDSISSVLVRMGLMSAAATEDAAAIAALTSALEANTAAQLGVAAGASEAGAALGAEGLAADAGAAEGALGGATEGAGLFAAALAPEVLIPVAGIAALALFIGKMGKAETAWTRAAAKFRETSKTLSNSTTSFTKDGEAYEKGMTERAAVTDKVTSARHHLIKLQKENAPEAKLTQAVLALNQAEREQISVGVQNAHSRVKSVSAARQTLAAAKANIAAAKEKIKANKEEQDQAIGPKGEPIKHSDLNPSILRKEAQAQNSLTQAQREAAGAARKLTVANIPLERQTRGLAPITDKTAASLKKLSTTIGSAATKKIGNFVNPSDVAKVASLSNHLTKLGQGSTVKKIDVKSNGADQTINKLQQVSRQSNKISGKVAQLNVKTNDTGAQQKLSHLSQLSQKVTGAKNTIRILANSSNAEDAIQRLSAHLRAVAQRRYQARLDAIDATGGPLSAAQRKLLAIAQKRYQSRLTAIDNASHPAAAAKRALEAVGKQHPNPTINVNAAQANATIQTIIGQLGALNGYTAQANVYVGLSGPGAGKLGGHYSGGPSIYMPSFASGGPTDREMERAAERAQKSTKQGSQRISKPTMLVGEQAPQHAEYVIATNPAFANQNKRYLNQAAGDLGYEVIPAYKQGKGGSGAAPYKKQSKRHWKVHNHTFAPPAVDALNQSEGSLSNLEGQFNAELTREEQEIAHKKRSAWDFATLKGFLNQEASLQNRIIHNIVPNIVQASTSARDQAEKQLHGPLSKGKLTSAKKEATKLEHDASKIKEPKAKKAAQRGAKQANAYANRLEAERSSAITMREDAQAELKEVRHEVIVEHETALKEIETEQLNVDEIEHNPEFAPYYESPDAGGATPTLGEQTSSYNTARQELYQSFGSNVAAQGVLATQPGGALSASNSPGSFNYLPGNTTGQDSGPFVGAGGTGTGNTPNSNTIINNFAYPPPDPHTWAAQQSFEIGALA